MTETSAVKVAIIGGTGLVGSELVKKLSADPRYEPVAIIRNTLTASVLGRDRHYVRIGSITDADSANRLLGDCQVVVNCTYAGESPAARKGNLSLVQSLADTRSAKTIVNMSSVSVHASPFEACRMNFADPKPNSSYGEDKLAMEGILSRSLDDTDIQYYLLRMGHVFGAGQNASKLVLRDVQTLEFELPFGGRLASNALSISRATDGIIGLIADPPANGVYNFMDEPNRTWREIYDLHTKAWNLPPVLSMPDDKSHELRNFHLSQFGSRRPPVSQSIRRQLKSSAKFLIRNPATNNATTKKLYLRFRERVPARVDRRVMSTFGDGEQRLEMAAFDEARVKPSWLLTGDPIPGRNVPETVESVESRTSLAAGLRDWYENLTSFQWDTSEFDTH